MDSSELTSSVTAETLSGREDRDFAADSPLERGSGADEDVVGGLFGGEFLSGFEADGSVGAGDEDDLFGLGGHLGLFCEQGRGVNIDLGGKVLRELKEHLWEWFEGRNRGPGLPFIVLLLSILSAWLQSLIQYAAINSPETGATSPD